LSGSLLVDGTVTVILNDHLIFTGADNGANLQFAAVNRSCGPSGVDFTASVVSGSSAVAGVSDRHDEDDDNGRGIRDFEDRKDGGCRGLGFRDKGQYVSQHARVGHRAS
jgi:hypothetical protein